MAHAKQWRYKERETTKQQGDSRFLKNPLILHIFVGHSSLMFHLLMCVAVYEYGKTVNLLISHLRTCGVLPSIEWQTQTGLVIEGLADASTSAYILCWEQLCTTWAISWHRVINAVETADKESAAWTEEINQIMSRSINISMLGL